MTVQIGHGPWNSGPLREWLTAHAAEVLLPGMRHDPWRPLTDPLLDAVARLAQVPRESLFLGAGASQLLHSILNLPCWSSVFVLWPEFALYRSIVRVSGKPLVRIPVWRVAEIPEALIRHKSKPTDLLCLSSPRWMTGELVDSSIFADILKTYRGTIVVDETYIDFAPPNSSVLAQNFGDRVIVIRSFSKGWWLPGLRIGYAVSGRFGRGFRMGGLPPHSVSTPSAQLLLALLEAKEQLEHIEKARRFTVALRTRCEAALRLHPGLEVVPSQAPFGALIVNAGYPNHRFPHVPHCRPIRWPRRGLRYPIFEVDYANALLKTLWESVEEVVAR